MIDTDDSCDDADGDRYPNIFEVTHGSNPHDSTSIPTPDFIIDPVTGDDDHEDNVYVGVQHALNQADREQRSYPIVGLDGAENTIVDHGQFSNYTFKNYDSFYQRAVVFSLTLRHFRAPILSVSAKNFPKTNNNQAMQVPDCRPLPRNTRVQALPAVGEMRHLA